MARLAWLAWLGCLSPWLPILAGPYGLPDHFFLWVVYPAQLAAYCAHNTHISVRHTSEFVVLGESNAGNRSGDALHLILTDCRTIAKACAIHSDPAYLSFLRRGFKIMSLFEPSNQPF